MKKQKTQTKYGSVGGQALMEGIMMNGPKGKAMALRMPDGSISVEKKTFNSIKDKNKFFALPMIRGIVNLSRLLFSATNASWNPPKRPEWISAKKRKICQSSTAG